MLITTLGADSTYEWSYKWEAYNLNQKNTGLAEYFGSICYPRECVPSRSTDFLRRQEEEFFVS